MAEPASSTMSKLEAAASSLASILQSSAHMEDDLAEMGNRLEDRLDTVTAFSELAAPLQSQSMAAKALDSRINRAISSAFSVLQSFASVQSLERRLLRLSSPSPPSRHREGGESNGTRASKLSWLLEYVDCVDRLSAALGSVIEGCDSAVQRIQEAVEFLSRTKATDRHRIHRLKEALVTLRPLYEDEIDNMRYDGQLDEALLRLQDEYETILQRIRYKSDLSVPEQEPATADPLLEQSNGADQLASDLEVEVLRRISGTLAGNDCLDICIEIFVKVRYRRAAKALMKLRPSYLKVYAPEEIDAMGWEMLEKSITLWTQHLELAVLAVLAREKTLCLCVLSGVMDDDIWSGCFVKIADRVMAVFIRFGEGVARSSKAPPEKLLKILEMFLLLERLEPGFRQLFDSDAGADIRGRFRELQKLLVHAASEVVLELGQEGGGASAGINYEDRIEVGTAGSPPEAECVVVKNTLVLFVRLLAEPYRGAMGKVLRTEQAWKTGPLVTTPEETLFTDAVVGVLRALQTNVEERKKNCSLTGDRITGHVMAMNAYWHMHAVALGTELRDIISEEAVKKLKAAAEEAAYFYQKEVWGPVVRYLSWRGSGRRAEDVGGMPGAGGEARGRSNAFFKALEEVVRRHEKGRCRIEDVNLREQIKEAVVRYVVDRYRGFLQSNLPTLQRQMKPAMSPDSVRRLVERAFVVNGSGGKAMAEVAQVGEVGGTTKSGRRRTDGSGLSASASGDFRDA